MPVYNKKNVLNHEPVVYYCSAEKNIKIGSRCGPVKRDVFLIESCIRGYGTIIINGNKFSVTPRSCYFLLPGDIVTHVNDAKESREGYFCAVDGELVASVIKKVGIDSKNPFAPSEAFDEIYGHLRSLYLSKDESDPGAELRQVSHIYGILGALLRSEKNTDKNMWIQKAIGYMETYYPEDISVATLAAQIGLDRSYFSTLFKTQMGISPHTYLTRLRVRKAAALIDEGGYSMTEIAYAVGLAPQNFARVFQRESGKTPRDYKNRAKSTEDLYF